MKYITGNELAELMSSDKVATEDYLVVDVRNDDYAGGNIKNSLNQPSGDAFLSSINSLVEKTKDVPLVIFHCGLSQQRGPQAARIYEQTRLSHDLLDGRDVPYEVKVLQGGFTEFQAKFKDDPQLVEKWDKKVWGSEWSESDTMEFLNGQSGGH